MPTEKPPYTHRLPNTPPFALCKPQRPKEKDRVTTPVFSPVHVIGWLPRSASTLPTVRRLLRRCYKLRPNGRSAAPQRLPLCRKRMAHRRGGSSQPASQAQSSVPTPFPETGPPCTVNRSCLTQVPDCVILIDNAAIRTDAQQRSRFSVLYHRIPPLSSPLSRILGWEIHRLGWEKGWDTPEKGGGSR